MDVRIDIYTINSSDACWSGYVDSHHYSEILSAMSQGKGLVSLPENAHYYACHINAKYIVDVSVVSPDNDG